MKFKFLILIAFLLLFSKSAPIYATQDPRLFHNNKVGVNSLSPDSEAQEISSMVNNKGDWGYVVITIKSSERNIGRWQNVFNLFAKYHLIPIVRIATIFDEKTGVWQKPTQNDAEEWAEFLDKLYFPTQNRYVQIYNEVNHAKEWGGLANGAEYAKELDKTIRALKAKGENFFVLASPLDLSVANTESSIDAGDFFLAMETGVGGIFNKLDGWASHSYPNPDFSANPLKEGRLGIRGYQWELSTISKYISGKNLPIFITETGWRRSADVNGLSEQEVANNYKIAYEQVWTDPNLIVVAPFVFSYPESLFFPFSFKNTDSSFFKYHETVSELSKINGIPPRENNSGNLKIDLPEFVLNGSVQDVKIKIQNKGNFIWNAETDINVLIDGLDFSVGEVKWESQEIFPGQEANAKVELTFLNSGFKLGNVSLFWKDNLIAQNKFSTQSLNLLSYFLENIRRKTPFRANLASLFQL